MTMNTADLLQKAVETYRARNKQYGDNYKNFGKVMVALFPNGLHLNTVDDFNRFGVIIQVLSKLTRYTNIPMEGHIDSIHDMGVYCFMLEELDLAIAERDAVKKPTHLDPVFWHAGGRIQDRDNPRATTPAEPMGWYFWDETQAGYLGGYDSEFKAREMLEEYAKSLHCEHVWGDLRQGHRGCKLCPAIKKEEA